MQLVGHEAQIAEGAELQREAEPVGATPLSSHQGQVAVGEREIPDRGPRVGSPRGTA